MDFGVICVLIDMFQVNFVIINTHFTIVGFQIPKISSALHLH